MSFGGLPLWLNLVGLQPEFLQEIWDFKIYGLITLSAIARIEVKLIAICLLVFSNMIAL